MHPEVLTPVDCWPTATHNSLIKRVTNKGISLHERRGSVSLTQHLHQLDPRTRAPSGHAWGSGSDPDSGPDSGPSPAPGPGHGHGPAPGPASGTFRPGLRPASGHASGPDSSLAPHPDPAPAPSPASGPASGHASGLDSSLAPHPVPPPASGHASNHVDSRPPSLPHSTGKTAPPFPSSPPSLLAGSSSKFESGYKSDSESGDDHDDDSDDDHDGGGHNGVHNSSHNEPKLPFFNFAPNSPLSEILSAPAPPVPDWTSAQRIFFNLQCEQSSITCEGMSQTLDLAGWYVSQVLPSLSQLLILDNTLSCIPPSQRFSHRLLRTIRQM